MPPALADTATRSTSAALARVSVALACAVGCAPRGTPATREVAAVAPHPSATASSSPPSHGAPASAPCLPFRVDELPPTSPQPGLQLFELNGSVPSFTLSGHVVCLPHEADAPLVLIPFEGGSARRMYGEGIKLNRYASDTANSSLIVVAGSSESCPAGVHAFDPLTLSPRWYLPSSHAWKPNPLSNRSMWGTEDAGLLAFRTFSAPDGAAASQRQLMLVRSTTGELVWQRLVPSTTFIAGFSGPSLLVNDRDSVLALSLEEGRELWRSQLPAAATTTRIQGQVIAAIRMRSASSPPDRPEPCAAQPCAFDLQISDTKSGEPRWRVPLGNSEFAFLASLALDGTDVIAEVPAEVRGFSASRVVAFDPLSGRERWSVGPMVCAFRQFGATFELTPTTLYSCTCDGVLRAISRADGRVRSEWGAGTCGDIFPGDTWTLLSTSGGLARLDWEALQPARSVIVRGRVKALWGAELSFPRWVRVGPKLVRTDRAGRFRTVLTARGEYSADVAVESNEPVEADTVVFSVDPHRREFELELTVLPPHG